MPCDFGLRVLGSLEFGTIQGPQRHGLEATLGNTHDGVKSSFNIQMAIIAEYHHTFYESCQKPFV